MVDLNDLLFFVKVVEYGGYSAASRTIEVPKSKLSRRIIGLENRLGMQLVERITRRFDLAPIGKEYFHYCQAMVDRAETAEKMITLAKRRIVRVFESVPY